MIKTVLLCFVGPLFAACAVREPAVQAAPVAPAGTVVQAGQVAPTADQEQSAVTIRVFTPRDAELLRDSPVGSTCLFCGDPGALSEGWVVCNGQVVDQQVGQLNLQVRMPQAPGLWLPCGGPLSPPKPGRYTYLAEEIVCAWGWEPVRVVVIRRLR